MSKTYGRESWDTEPWNSHRLENYLHEAVCAGPMPIDQAQREIAQNWIATYQKYLGKP